MTRLSGSRILVDLHENEQIIKEGNFRAQGNVISQHLAYEWITRPCSTYDKWGHEASECDLKRKWRSWGLKESTPLR